MSIRTPEQIADEILNAPIPLGSTSERLFPVTRTQLRPLLEQAAREAQTRPDFKPEVTGEFRASWEAIERGEECLDVECTDGNTIRVTTDQARRILAMLSTEAQ